MIEPLKFPGSPSAQSKAVSIADGTNTINNLCGDDTFIKVQRGRGYAKISLNILAVISRIPKVVPNSVQCFKVASLPAAVSGIVPPYAVCNSYSNTSTGTSNVSVGVVVAHSVGDVLYANPVPSIMNSGTPLLDNLNKSIGMLEVGTYGTVFECGCNQSGGTNGSAGVLCSFTYYLTVTGSSGTVNLAGPLSRKRPQGFAYAVTPATTCYARLAPTGSWELIEPWESQGSNGC